MFKVSDEDLGLLDDNDDYYSHHYDTHTYTSNEEDISDIKFTGEEKKIQPTTTSIQILFSPNN